LLLSKSRARRRSRTWSAQVPLPRQAVSCVTVVVRLTTWSSRKSLGGNVKLLKALVMVLALAAGIFGSFTAISQPQLPPHDTRAAFEFACSILEYDCSQVEPPQIVWSDLYHTYSILGGYNGEASIYMDNSVLRWADPAFTQSVLAHEIAHYLDVQLGVVQLPMVAGSLAVCESEYRGWRVGNAYVIAHDRPDLADFEWHVRYNCYF
jgi:hypothetical protein